MHGQEGIALPVVFECMQSEARKELTLFLRSAVSRGDVNQRLIATKGGCSEVESLPDSVFIAV